MALLLLKQSGLSLKEAADKGNANWDMFTSFQHLLFPQVLVNGLSVMLTGHACETNYLELWDLLLSVPLESTQLFVVDQEIIIAQ